LPTDVADLVGSAAMAGGRAVAIFFTSLSASILARMSFWLV
jgi:hypothetical protein